MDKNLALLDPDMVIPMTEEEVRAYFRILPYDVRMMFMVVGVEMYIRLLDVERKYAESVSILNLLNALENVDGSRSRRD